MIFGMLQRLVGRRHGPGMAKRRGFMLVVSVVFVGAIAITLTLLARQFFTIHLATREAELDVRAGQLLAAGQAWWTLHPDAFRRLPSGATLELPVSELVADNERASLSIRQEPPSGRILLTARVERGRIASRLSAPLSLPPEGGEPD